MKFKVGDRVRYVVKRDIDNVKVGEAGIIRGISSSGNYAVDFEESGYKHNCGGLCQNNHGWWCSGDTLEPVAIRSVLFPNVEYVFNEKQAKEYADNIMATAESISDITGISYENSINKLKTCLGAFPNNGISAKNGGKNSMKFTFYVTEGTRIDKSCNKTVPTMTTFVSIGRYHSGKATCDKADYDKRQGCLEAIANAFLDGNFDREFNKAVKKNKLIELHDRTCTYCGKVFDTVEELKAHEAWHVERRKARHERYLLRKRAKEIAFEEQAQKLAKEMTKEDK